MSPSFSPPETAQPRVWPVGALCHAIADALHARFNPVAVEGEISGLNVAGSGHMYFSIKDESGQLRCAMFRRAASLLDFSPRDGEKVIVKGRLTVYEPRGDLQMVVESLSRSGQGALFEQFLRLKARLQEEGLFDAERKRQLSLFPHGIAVVTSLNAAALHDVVTALRRRSPHVPVMVVPALVQGAQAPAALVQALQRIYRAIAQRSLRRADGGLLTIDAILLVRGGGSIEDLWAFNDESLARAIVNSPVPLVSGVGHETDFTIADFCADVRAPTPTAAAELAATSQEQALGVCAYFQDRLDQGTDRWLQKQHQKMDRAASRLVQPSMLMNTHRARLQWLEQSLKHQSEKNLARFQARLEKAAQQLPHSMRITLERLQQQHAHAQLRLDMLNPQRVLERGYAILQDKQCQPVKEVENLQHGQHLYARVAKGQFEVKVVKQGELEW